MQHIEKRERERVPCVNWLGRLPKLVSSEFKHENLALVDNVENDLVKILASTSNILSVVLHTHVYIYTRLA